MKTQLSLLTIILLAIVSCEKSKESEKLDSKKQAKASAVKSTRPRHGVTSSPQDKLRAAIVAAKSIEATDERDRALALIVSDALKVSPDISTEAFNLLSPNYAERMQLLQKCAKFLVERNADEAIEWAATLESEKDIAAAKGKIALLLADTDPERAINIVPSSGFGTTRLGAGVWLIVLRHWASRNPADAARWAIARPPGDERRSGIKAVLSCWIQTDAPSAFSWISKINTETDRKEAIQAMAEAIAPIVPAMRESILESADPSIRGEIEEQSKTKTKEAGTNIPEELRKVIEMNQPRP